MARIAVVKKLKWWLAGCEMDEGRAITGGPRTGGMERCPSGGAILEGYLVKGCW